jgi:DNA-binding transcriptional MerR regulator
MPYIEREIEKVYWDIGEIANTLGVETCTLRFWESELPDFNVRKGKRGNRKYTRETATEIFKINYLRRHCGVSMVGIKLAYEEGFVDALVAFYQTVKPLRIVEV